MVERFSDSIISNGWLLCFADSRFKNNQSRWSAGRRDPWQCNLLSSLHALPYVYCHSFPLEGMAKCYFTMDLRSTDFGTRIHFILYSHAWGHLRTYWRFVCDCFIEYPQSRIPLDEKGKCRTTIFIGGGNWRIFISVG